VLTPREKRLLRRFAQGRTEKSIARELCEPVERIAAQRERIFEKLQIQSPDQLAEIALRFASWGQAPEKKLRPLELERNGSGGFKQFDCGARGY
jgi:DNA-binding CsgD family transcriptional regulator